MITLDVESLDAVALTGYLQYLIAPRPICLASTVDGMGNVNVSPFSFFNVFSLNPPICVFSPSRRVRDNTSKHTLENLHEVAECVINLVNFDMVQQTSLASSDYPKGSDEFEKAGFTKVPSIIVRPPRVKESPAQLECRIQQIIPLGSGGGAGNLVIAEIVLLHISPHVLDDAGKVDQTKLDLVSRLGGNWYGRTEAHSLFEVPKPAQKVGIGIDALPEYIKTSPLLTGNHLARLATVEKIPLPGNISMDKEWDLSQPSYETLFMKAADLLAKEQVTKAWELLLHAATTTEAATILTRG